MLRYVCLLLFATALARHSRRKRDAKETIQAGVNQAIQKWINGDVEGIMEYYTENAIFIDGKGKMRKGTEEIKAFVNSMKGKCTAGSFTANHIVSDDDMAAVIGLMKITLKKDEVETEAKVTWLGILRKVDDMYKVVVEGVFAGDGTQHDHSRRRRDTVQEQIRARHDDFLKKLGEGKLEDAMKGSYLEDSKYIKPCGGIVEGRDSITQYMATTGKDAKDFSTTITEVVDSTKLAFEVGLTKFKAPHNGEEMQHSMRYIAVWKKTDNGLRVAIDSLFAGDGEHVHPMG